MEASDSLRQKKINFFVLYLTHPHMLRHTFCTRCAEAGLDIKVLQMIMGHSDISITMNIYNHVDAARVQNEMKKLENVM
ncbi:tyrosine-type recombinase/integrase [Blautia luti]|uniref:tyrosine-type recombinase/integrase n=2 Tax=Blautia TaxID=572511 RepID=UPI001D006A6D|nr:tyrosine-type recombinase/integrase [Blautia luti]MCB5475926.1 tyrosine-type recombinase/integrase [Blautia luti]